MMAASFTSFSFFCFLAVVLVVHYCVPIRFRWVFLLAASIVYYLLTGEGALILFPAGASLVAYAGGLWIEGRGEKKLPFIITTVLLIGVLLLLKQFRAFPNLLLPLGLSFYTLSLLSYVIDVKKGKIKPEKNPAKLLLYGLYFPNILSGPILRYESNGSELFKEHRLSYKNLTFGLQRMLWGIFKVLVISERCALFVNPVHEEYWSYRGGAILLAIAVYMLQLYTNFSGSMDLVLGISELFGIRMPENFDLPFLSGSVSEFWRRWHITLGGWFRDYVYIPLGGNRKGTARKYVNTLIVFTLSGLWHDSGLGFLIWGFLQGLFIVLEQALAKPLSKLNKRLRWKEDGRFLKIFRAIRTFVLVAFAFLFFRAESARTALRMLGGIFRGEGAGISELGGGLIEMAILVISLVILFIGELLGRKKDLRLRLSEKPLPLRWALLFALLFYVILLGNYGPGYSAADFIYRGF